MTGLHSARYVFIILLLIFAVIGAATAFLKRRQP